MADPIEFVKQESFVGNTLEVIRAYKELCKRFLQAEAKLLGLDGDDVSDEVKALPGQLHDLSVKVDALSAKVDQVTAAEADTTLHDQVAKLQAKMDQLLPDGVSPNLPDDVAADAATDTAGGAV